MSWKTIKQSQINVVITKYKEGITVNSASPPFYNPRNTKRENHAESKGLRIRDCV